MTDSPGAKPQQPKRTQIKLEIPADLSAQYVNFAMITHSMSEIIFDLAQVLPGSPKSRVQSRLIFSPTNAKLLHKALGETIAKYESRHGEIKVPPTLADQLFSTMRVGDTAADDEGQADE